MPHTLISLVLIVIVEQSIVHCRYHYVGCYTHVFHETYFTSSFMEPTLCIRLCDTPIIYLQKTVCRCSGAGLMHYNRQNDNQCSIPCTKPVDRSVQTKNTCGGSYTYSVYVQENFYSQHEHLLDYRIQFSACELWRTSNIYETVSVQIDQNNVRTSLNQLERCAASCLDKTVTTKSIGNRTDNA
jgi:hypothetical protein